jgi:hypothetical protein
VLDHGVHDRPPAHAELLGHLRQPAGRAHPPAGTPRRPLAGSARPARRGARSAPSRSCVHTAAPDSATAACARPAVRDDRSRADLEWRPRRGRAPRRGCHSPRSRPRGRRLDPDDELVGCLAHRQHPEPIESQQRLSQASTVAHRQGFLLFVAVNSNEDGGTPGRERGSSPTGGSPVQRDHDQTLGSSGSHAHRAGHHLRAVPIEPLVHRLRCSLVVRSGCPRRLPPIEPP